MMDNHYLDIWQLSNPRPVTETATSQIYTVEHHGETVILKLLKPIGIADEKNGAVALRHFDGHGAVRLFQADDQAHLLEYADGDNLVGLVRRGDDERATHIIADVLNQLHSLPVPSEFGELTPLYRRFRSLFRVAEQHQQQGNHSIFVRASLLAEDLLANPRDSRVLHGDIHHENIRHHPKRGWLAFDPKGLIGERTFDVANTLCNPLNMPEIVVNETRLLRHIAILAEKMSIEQSRILAFVYVYACLSACWSLEDGMDAHEALAIAKLAERHLR